MKTYKFLTLFAFAIASFQPATFAQTGSSNASVDQTFWQSIDKTSPVELRLYLNQYPNGLFAPIAKQRLAESAASVQSPAPAVTPNSKQSDRSVASVNSGWTKHSDRYFTRGDEVADRLSRLVWRRCIEGTTWDGKSCQGTPKLVKGDEAIAIVKGLNEAKTPLAPWRLPTVYDFLTIKHANKKPTGLFVDDLFSYQPLNSAFATTTPVSGQSGYFWFVQFHLAEEHCFEEDRKKATMVRLVRPLTAADQVEPAPADEWTYLSERFRIKGAEILDTKTALIWKRCSEGMQWNGVGCSGTAKEFAWVDVRRHASSPELIEQGYRVPERGEVRSIFEKNTCSYEAMSDSVFDDAAANNYFWSGSVAAYGASGTFVPKMDSGRGGDANRRTGMTLLRMVRSQN
jgi:Protein of unknown function (DUF1566)